MKVKSTSPLDIGIGVLALAGAVICAYLLKDSIDNVSPLRSGHAKLVGQVEVLRQGVRVKTLEDYSWYPLKNGTNVYTGDTIFTGNDSQAVLRLGSGADEIRLEPFSLITLSERDGLAEVTLHFGEFESDLSHSALVVNSDGERSLVQADGASIRLKKESQQVNIEVLDGNVEIDRAGEKQSLTQNQFLALSEAAVSPDQQAFAIQPPPPPPLLPQAKTIFQVPNHPSVEYAGGLYRVPPHQALKLSWEGSEKARVYEVVFAKDPEFEEVLSVRRFAAPQAELRVVPQDGFFWKVRNQSEELWSEFSEAGQLNVTVPAFSGKPSEPLIEVVDEERAFVVQEIKPFQGVKQLEVEYRAEETAPWESTVLSSPFLKLEGSRGQNLMWRARPLSRVGQAVGPFSETQKVHLAEELFLPLEPLEPPEPVISPAELARRELQAQALSRPPLLRGPAQQETIVALGETPSYMVFDWKAHEAVTEYLVQVSKDPQFQQLVTEKVVDQPLFVFTGHLDPGVYYWRVRSSLDGGNSPWSRAKSVRIEKP